MSGPKSYRYEVEQRALREVREQRALVDAIERLRRRSQELAAESAHAREIHGERVTQVVSVQVATSGTLAQLRDVQARLTSQVKHAEQTLHAESSAATQALLSTGVRTGTSTRAEDVDTVLARRSTTPRSSEPAEAEVRRLLTRLDCRDESDLAGIRSAVATALAADGTRRQLCLDDLRMAITKVNAREASRSAVGSQIDEMLAELDGLDPAAVATARERLIAARSTELDQKGLARLREMVGDAVAAAERFERREFVVSELARALSDAGYSVSGGFETAIVRDGYVDVRSHDANWDGYAVRVRLPEDEESVGFNLVRGPVWRPDQNARDVDMEKRWCEDLANVRDGLAGVALAPKRLLEPGAVPLQEVDMPVPAAATSRRASIEEQL